ncbi:hypothetical protein [Halorhabdus rudnickae]|uniref:hypothetical protein n=1 Tax=Halorhabdus rudnickae TaxID=1775544 RepID=UPI001083A377|nr:hypothetical protein [Halorhabdus rudnickae]
MITPDNLKDQIDQTRLKYTPRSHGASVQGGPFVCYFGETVDPGVFLDQITEVGEPWHFFGATSKIHNGYWTCKGNLLHVENGEQVWSSEVTLEVSDEWVRIYVFEESSAARVAEFVQELDDRYGVRVEFSDPRKPPKNPVSTNNGH